MAAIEYFRSATGKEPVKEFVDSLAPKDRSRVFRGQRLSPKDIRLAAERLNAWRDERQ